MKLKAGQRLQGMRELMGLTRDEFSDLLDIPWVRLRNVEQQKARMAEDEFAKIGQKFPEFMPWITYEGAIVVEDLRNSPEALCQLAAAKITAGQIPSGYFIHDKIK
ncbi:helix-turn-helix domain-containing protein [Microbulbifer sp. OS29]|uniref:Helix-turn-helix domain-containing protein n=1 Tax=Microbulbifer okhotskensis TaxID=2926617 RepID=A0A9X2ERD2_9GAMM|nr:helix-turn-helix transcriptional regulator [Microbulbifer okhotskensis]MCO1336414.1 helix-turn-helix domain-containing protein [Microbulbifer okhotskensis]